MRTQVAIIGAGPAGLLLSHLLAAEGVESVGPGTPRGSNDRLDLRERLLHSPNACRVQIWHILDRRAIGLEDPVGRPEATSSAGPH